MAIVTRTIGTSGRNYSTITAWEADLDNGAIYASADDAVGEVYNDSVFDEAFDINGGGTIGLNSITLTVPSSERHDGTAGIGARIVSTSGGASLIDTSSARTVSIEWLEADANGQAFTEVVKTTPGAAVTHTLRNMLIHGSTRAAITSGIAMSNANTVIMNTFLYDITESGSGGAANPCRGIRDSVRATKLLNLTVHNISNNGGSGAAIGIQVDDLGGYEYQNIIVTDVGGTTTGSKTCFSDSSITNATANSLASSDATASGTGALTNVVTADQYVSTVLGSEDLHLKAGSDCIGAGVDLGTTPANVNIDINGRDRDAEGDTWDIGGHQFVAAGGGQTVVVGQSSETDTAQSITPVKPITQPVGQAAETDSAFSITPVVTGEQVVAIGQAVETDSAQSVTPIKPITVAIGQAVEADSAQSITPLVSTVITIGQAAEADSAQSITPVKPIIQAVGQAAETNTAQPISPFILSPIVVVVGQATETDSAQSITPSLILKSVTCTLVNRNGTALPGLVNLSWAWFDSTDPNNFGAPSDQGEVESTDGSGELVIDLAGTTLSAGQFGTLVLRANDGSALGAYNLEVA